MHDKAAIKANRKARRLALQCTYQWLMAGTDIAEIESQACAANNMDLVNSEYFKAIIYGVTTNKTQLEDTFKPYLDIQIAQLNPIELAILYISTFELLNKIEIPFRIILDEAVWIAKEYGSKDGHRFVNGVLNKVARNTRKQEI